jgi:SEC-C motif-containing protein
MRSRFSAFAVGDPAYLLTTWHPRTRPASLELDPAQRWYRLDILQTTRGGMLDTEGTVEFRAHFRYDGPPDEQQPDRPQRGEQHEVSRFVREDRRWYYLDEL